MILIVEIAVAVIIVALVSYGAYTYCKVSKELKQKQSQIQEEDIALTNRLSKFHDTEEEMVKAAEALAERSYQAKISALEDYYKKNIEEAEQQLSSSLAEVKEQEDKLADLKSKQSAIIESQLRETKKQNDMDYYRLVLTYPDMEDIKVLRELQKQLYHKDAIDKVIWEVYYKPAFDILSSHFFKTASTKICGIYKITNIQTGMSYIGQSLNIRERWRQHIKSALSFAPSTNKLYQTMQKYGVENFTFEILEELSNTQLNEHESYWIDYYKTKEYGLNSTKGNGG